MVNNASDRPHSEKFLRMLDLLCQSSQKIAVYDSRLALSWTNAEFDWPDTLPDSPSELRQETTDHLIALKGEAWTNCYLMPLQIFRTDSAAFVLAYFDQKPEVAELSAFAHQIRVAQGLMKEADWQDSRLKQSTRELRHFQQLSDSVAGARLIENPELELNRLLSDCRDSMTLAAAFVYQVDEKQVTADIEDELLLENTGLSAARRNSVLQRDLFRLCETGSAPFVLNQFAEKGASSARKQT